MQGQGRDKIYDDAVTVHRMQKVLPAMPVQPLPLPPFRHQTVAGRSLFIADDFADGAAIARLYRFSQCLPFRRFENDRRDTREVRSFSADLDPQFLVDEPLFSRFDEAVAALFPSERQRPYRAYVNCTVYGDMQYPHRDCDPERPDITILYYLNQEWPRDWAGETLFFDDDSEPSLALLPKPGRVAIFRGAIEHRGGVPSRECLMERLTLVYKLRP